MRKNLIIRRPKKGREAKSREPRIPHPRPATGKEIENERTMTPDRRLLELTRTQGYPASVRASSFHQRNHNFLKKINAKREAIRATLKKRLVLKFQKQFFIT